MFIFNSYICWKQSTQIFQSVWCGSQQKGLFSPVQLSRIFIAALLWKQPRLCLAQIRTFCTMFKTRMFWKRGNITPQLDSAVPPHMNTYGIYFEYYKWSSFGQYVFTVFPPHVLGYNFIGTKRHNCSWSKQYLYIRF